MLRRKPFHTLSLYAALGASLLFLGCPRDGRHGYQDPHQRADKIVSQMQKGLELSEDQTAQVKKLAYEVVDTMEARMHENMENRDGEFLKQLRATTVDTAALSGEMQKRRDDMRAGAQEHMQERQAFMIAEFVKLHDILTPEQRDKLAAFLEKHREQMRQDWDHPGE